VKVPADIKNAFLFETFKVNPVAVMDNVSATLVAVPTSVLNRHPKLAGVAVGKKNISTVKSPVPNINPVEEAP
jgi:hypothetical protein